MVMRAKKVTIIVVIVCEYNATSEYIQSVLRPKLVITK